MKASRLQLIARIILYGLCAVLVALSLYPVSTRLTRTGQIAAAALIWVALLGLTWPHRKTRCVLFVLTGLLPLFCLMPDRPRNAEKLRTAYVRCLEHYEGTTYWWGGENAIGIDCSGLVRKALVLADVQRGLLTFDGVLVRRGLDLWWHDCTARTLGEDRSRTRPILEASAINDLDHTALLPGDLAVTSGGVHVLAYLGDRTWIQADPTAGKVVIARSPSTDVSYYSVPVRIVRWRQLENGDRTRQ